MPKREKIGLYTSSPCASGEWMVWDTYEALPPKPVFIGSMEDASLTADALNKKLRKLGQSAGHPTT